MSSISVNDIKPALVNRVVSNWDTATAPDMTATSGAKLLHAASFSVSSVPQEYSARTIGLGNFVSSVEKTIYDNQVSLVSDIMYGSQVWAAVAAFLGKVETPVSGSGPSYTHTLDMGSVSSGSSSMAYNIESDQVMELPNIAWTSLSMNVPNADVGQITLNGIVDVVVDPDNAENTVADLESLSFGTASPEGAVWAGCSGYFRVGPYSETEALTSGNDVEVLSATVEITRPLQTRYVQRGCESAFTQMPRMAGQSQGNLTFQLGEQDSAVLDIVNDWKLGNRLMAEICIAGEQIGTGEIRQVKIQLPCLEIVQLPAGLDASGGITSLIQPTVTCRMLKAPAAPAGMTGVTDYIRIVLVDTNSDSYLA